VEDSKSMAEGTGRYADPFTLAAVQASPVLLDREATVRKACALIDEAGRAGADLALFPEAYVPGYPLWVWYVPPGQTRDLRSLYAELLEQAVRVPDGATDQLCTAAKEAGVAVVIGINEVNTEGSGSSLYNTILYIGSDGRIVGKHRKLVPTAAERMIWAAGDGSDLETYATKFGRLSGLICWENYMPLARYALYAWGTEVYVAPTWDRGEPWLSTLRHIAKEGRCYVVGCCSAIHRDDIPDRLEFKAKYLPDEVSWINPGHSVIVDPDGRMIAGPVAEREEIIYARCTRATITGPRWQLDVAGHYGRPDIFELIVHRRPRHFLRVQEDSTADTAPPDIAAAS